MAIIAEKHTSQSKEIKENIRSSRQYFLDNIKTYHKFMNFVCKTSLTDGDIQNLEKMNKPAIEFNIIEAIISRLRGEFAKQEPSIEVRLSDGAEISRVNDKTIAVLNSYLRALLDAHVSDNIQYKFWTDLLIGGYSVAKVYTDYINEMSFDQTIKIERAFDPTITGFDPLARESHKGDGAYCYELYPMEKSDFIREFGEEHLKGVKFGAGLEGFSWSYKAEEKEVVLVADYYKKVHKKIKVAKLSSGHVINKAHYNAFLELWDDKGFIEQPPIVIEERTTEIETIWRYRLCENGLLEAPIETNYKHFPLIFIDGNSVYLKNSDAGSCYQMTRPFAYHAYSIQKLKNLSGQTLAAQIQNMMTHPLITSIESIPSDPVYQSAYKNPQLASILVYNQFYKNNPEVRLDPPIQTQPAQTPPIIENTFMGTDKTTQIILGSYDSALAIDANALSGKAIQQGALQSNGASIPYLVGYMNGLNRICQILLDLIPKYIVTPRTIPIILPSGKRKFQVINNPDDPESVSLEYNPNDLQVSVEAGVNSSIQKQMALEEITAMMQASPVFAEFINSKGLSVILDNMDIRNIDHLKLMAEEFEQELEMRKGQPPPPSDAQILAASQEKIEMAKVEAQREKARGEHATATARVAVEKQNADTKVIEVLSLLRERERKGQLDIVKADSQAAKEAIEIALDVAAHHQSNAALASDMMGE